MAKVADISAPNAFKEVHLYLANVSALRFELLGSRVTLPGGDIVVPGGVETILEAMAVRIKRERVMLNRRVTMVDWSLLSRDPRKGIEN
jgi:hypothetical protein